MACLRDALISEMFIKQPRLPEIWEVGFEISRLDVVEKNQESTIERAVPICDLPTPFLRLRTSGSDLCRSDAVNVRLGEVAIRVATVLTMWAVVPDKCKRVSKN